MSLHWSPPAVSTDYNNETVEFLYQVTVNTIGSSMQPVKFNTTNQNTFNLSAANIPDGYDICGNYSWNVAAIIEERSSVGISNEMILIPSRK